MRAKFGNNCAKGCFLYIVAFVLIVVITSMGLGGLRARFGGAEVQGQKPGVVAITSGQDQSPPASQPAGVTADGIGGGELPTPQIEPSPVSQSQPPPQIPAQPQPVSTSVPPPPVQAQGQGGTITAETSPPFYIVQAGDTLWAISRKLGVDMDALRTTNNVADNIIHPGDLLYLSGSAQATAPTASVGDSTAPGAGSGESQGQGPTLPTMPNTGITSRKP